jgi:hypothetical protein
MGQRGSLKTNVVAAWVFAGVLLLAPTLFAQPVEDKVGVLITGWGMPSGYNFNYSYYGSIYPRCGDLTEFEGQPCKFGHVGELPYMAHINLIPWSICFETPGRELLYDNSGVYILEDGVYVSPNEEIPSLLPGDIPEDIPVVPLVEVLDRNDKLTWPPDPRTGEDYLEGWYRIGSFDQPLPNGYADLNEQGPAYYVRYYGHITSPSDFSEWPYTPSFVQEQEELTEEMLIEAFGDSIDVRFGFYGEAPPYTKLSWDVAEEFSNEGFTKMLLARETTDNNRYANDFMTGGYVRERLCELGTLEDTEIHQTRQVGRTPEFNAMNVINLQPFIEAYPEGSTIAIIYSTRGLPWGVDETPGWFGRAHPFSKEIYFENAYLNYISWKRAIEKAYGDRYDLVFTREGVESDIMEDNFFTFGLSEEPDLLGFAEEQIYYSIRNAIQFAIEDGLDKIIVAPCHWNYDNLDTILRMKEINGLPLTPKTDLAAGIFEMTHCEDAEAQEVACSSPTAVVEITVAPSYSQRAREFATSYYVVLRGTLEKFGLFPEGEQIRTLASREITKEDGGTVQVRNWFSLINRAKIEIPADPYPGRPQDFTHEDAIPVNDPEDSYDCMWEDTVISIHRRINPPAMENTRAVGPAVQFGPYRNFFNRDVTVTIPYYRLLSLGKEVKAYIYNHVSEDWDAVEVESVRNGLVTFKTQVLGLFQAGVE